MFLALGSLSTYDDSLWTAFAIVLVELGAGRPAEARHCRAAWTPTVDQLTTILATVAPG